MNKKNSVAVYLSGFWGRVMAISLMLFFVYLGDGILSDWVPSFMQKSLGGSLAMGLVMSFSSIVGFGSDLIFPQLLRTVKTRKLMLLAMASSLIFSGILLWTIVWPWVVMFLIAMAVWGVYYEFLGFGGKQFVAESIPMASRSSVWAIMSTFKSLAYFLGPIIGSYLTLNKGNKETIAAAVFFVFLGYLIWLFSNKTKKIAVTEMADERVNILTEIKRWKVLSVHVWPVLLISLVMGLIDATFWTTGTVLSDSLAGQNWLGGMFLPFYMLPMVIFGVVVARWGIYRGKKKIAEISMLLAGVFLTIMGVTDSVYVMLGVSLLTGTVLSVAWPLTDAVYSDIITRMGKEGKHMMGLSGSTISMSYIAGPILAGGIAQLVGERMTFSVMGIGVFVLAIFLLLVTPKKLRLPQEEIQTW